VQLSRQGLSRGGEGKSELPKFERNQKSITGPLPGRDSFWFGPGGSTPGSQRTRRSVSRTSSALSLLKQGERLMVAVNLPLATTLINTPIHGCGLCGEGRVNRFSGFSRGECENLLKQGVNEAHTPSKTTSDCRGRRKESSWNSGLLWCLRYRGFRRMEYNEIAAKRQELKSQFLYAPFASLRGYSPVPFSSLRCGLFSKWAGDAVRIGGDVGQDRPRPRSGYCRTARKKRLAISGALRSSNTSTRS